MSKAFKGKAATFVLSALVALLLAPAAAAQVTTGTSTGRVHDSQGSVVSGAKVTVTNRGTAAERTTIASSDGEYTVAQLPPGR